MCKLKYFLPWLVLVSSQAFAVTVIYDESVSGDISGRYYENYFTLSPGANEIRGNVWTEIYWDVGMDDSDYDSYMVYVPDGRQLTSLSFDYTFTDDNDGYETTLFGYGFTLVSCQSQTQCGWYSQDYKGATLYKWTAEGGYTTETTSVYAPRIQRVLPLLEDLSDLPGGTWYQFSPATVTYNGGGTMDYTVTFNVTPVPLPPAMWMFGIGLLGLVGAAKRKIFRRAE